MSKFIGYTKRPEPRWPFFVIPLIIFMVFLAFAYILTPAKQSGDSTTTSSSTSTSTTLTEEAATTTTVTSITTTTEKNGSKMISGNLTVEKIVFASEMSGSLPADDLGEGPVTDGRIYCYSKIVGDELPAEIWHVWIDPNNKVIADVHLNARNNPSHLWSYISLYGERKGTWQVQIKDASEKVIASKSFIY